MFPTMMKAKIGAGEQAPRIGSQIADKA